MLKMEVEIAILTKMGEILIGKDAVIHERDEIIKAGKHIHHKEYDEAADCIRAAFRWKNTADGLKFWQTISGILRDEASRMKSSKAAS